jgi:hypothetical protein
MSDTLFSVDSPLGYTIRTTKDYWKKIITEKHPSMRGKERTVRETIAKPDEIRRSKRDSHVFLYYRSTNSYRICVVARHENGEGFIVTTYPTRRILEGERVWPK